MTERQAPYPPETKAKGWRFELDLEQVMQSDTWALASAEVRPWLLMLWATAWQQQPCGSMPADEDLIVARLGMPPKLFARSKKTLMRGWWRAEDGRLYHPTITTRVLDMLGRKDAERNRKAEWRARKEAELKLAEANAQANLSHDVPPMSQGTDVGQQGQNEMSHGTDAGRTWDSHGTDDTGTGTGTGLDSSTPPPSRAGEGEIVSRGTDAGRICKAMRQAGMAACNPSNPTLRVLIDAGASDAEFVEAARKAVGEGKGFSYALGIVTGERRRAAELARQVHRGELPPAETTYQRSMRERMQEVAPEAARRAPSGHPAHAAEFFNAIEVPMRALENAK